jgi:hypothetical protein
MPLDSHSKLARVREAMASNDWKRAIRLAARFPALGEHGPVIRRANDAINNPRLYKQLGHDLEEIRMKAIAALKQRFSKSWQNVEGSGKNVSERSKHKGD